MSDPKPLFVFVVGLLGIVTYSPFISSRALTAPANQSVSGDNGKAMEDLVNEVHLLRLAVQRGNLGTYQAQVVLERLRLLQPRVNSLNEKLEKVRAEIADVKLQQASASDELKLLESELSKETNPDKRRELEQESHRLKRLPETLAQWEQQEAQLIAQLQPEQVKLNDLNERLDVVQKDLEVLGQSQPAVKRP